MNRLFLILMVLLIQPDSYSNHFLESEGDKKQLEEQVSLEVKKISNSAELTNNQKLQLNGVLTKYSLEEEKTGKLNEAGLHAEISYILSEKQLNAYYRELVLESVEEFTDDQITRLNKKSNYTKMQLREIRKILLEYNIQKEIVREKYGYEPKRMESELEKLQYLSSHSVKKTLAQIDN